MAFSSYRANFRGTLAGIEIEKLRDLDRDLETLKERKEYINEKYKKIRAFYDAFIFTKEETIDKKGFNYNYTDEELTQYYKYNLNATDVLSSDINIFKYLEADATYLLNSRDLPKDKYNRNSNRCDDISLDECTSVIEPSNSNYRLNPKADIKAADFMLNDILFGDYDYYLEMWEKANVKKIFIPKNLRSNKNLYKNEKIIDTKRTTLNYKLSEEQFYRYKELNKKKIIELRQQEKGRKYLYDKKVELQNKKYDDIEKERIRKSQLRLIINTLKEVKGDMIYTKVNYAPTIEIDPDKCSPESNLCDNIDYKDAVHVKYALLLKPNERISNDFNIIAYDIQQAIDKLTQQGDLNDYEIELIDTYRSSNYNMQYISKEMKKHKTQIYRDIDRIVMKIIKIIN